MESKPSFVAPQSAQGEAGNGAEAKPGDEAHRRLAYLFRVSLKEGRIHPLFHVIQQYRQKAR